jgi:class 3 adenylate cyclase
MTDELTKKYTNLIVLLQSFEGLWNFYSVSEGELFKKEVKESAKKLVAYFKVVYSIDPKIYNSKSIGYSSLNIEDIVRDRLDGLEKWASNDDLFPFTSHEMGANELSRFNLQGFLMCEKAYLCNKLQLDVFPNIISSSGEGAYTKNNIRWKGHLPWQAIDLISDEFVKRLSDTDTLVLVADIRKSQDLMTYGPSADFFRDKILEFTTQMREIIKNNFGIFDKFTGDGFLCYFNSHLCKQFRKDYYIQLIKSCKEIMLFSTKFFEDWIKHIRKLPPNSSGLTLGIDCGIVKFRDLDNHLFAIGDSIVWANRMSSAGKKGEIILNNIPYHEIKEKDKNLSFESFENITKGGESFTAYKMIIK